MYILKLKFLEYYSRMYSSEDNNNNNNNNNNNIIYDVYIIYI